MTKRVWDDFLSERDKAHLAIVGEGKRVGFGERPAVLMVDNYEGVFSEPGVGILDAARTKPGSIGAEAHEAADRIATLLEHARAAGIPVIHVTGMHGNNMPGWNPSIHAGDARGVITPEKAGAGDKYRIVEKCAPIEGEVVFQKTAPSAFFGTPLQSLLNFLDVDTLIVGGEAASGCVRASAVDAASYRYRVIVAEECVYDRHEAPRAINLFDLHQKYADVLPTDAVVAWIDAYNQAAVAA